MNRILNKTSLVTALLLLGLSQSALAGVAVVVSTNNSTSSLTKEQVAKIFLGKTKSFPNGSQVTPFDLPKDSSVRDKFYSKAVKKSNSQLTSYWARKIFTGKGQPPRELSDNSEMISNVSSDKGAIGYIDDSAVNSRVKVVLTLP